MYKSALERIAKIIDYVYISVIGRRRRLFLNLLSLLHYGMIYVHLDQSFYNYRLF